MGLIKQKSPFSDHLDQLTSEYNTDIDWEAVLLLCDRINRSPRGPRDFCSIIFAKLNHRVPYVSMHAITVLDACVNNCGVQFHREMNTPDFIRNLRRFVFKYKNPKVVMRMKYFIRKWAEMFRNNPNLSKFVSNYYTMQSEGVRFPEVEPQIRGNQSRLLAGSTTSFNGPSRQESEDLAYAIRASLRSQPSTSQTSYRYSYAGTNSAHCGVPTTHYGGAPSGSYTNNNVRLSTSVAQARSSHSMQQQQGATSSRGASGGGFSSFEALYDFEAAADNELNVRAGDVIQVVEKPDANWWKGQSARGVGIFPSSFVKEI